MLEVPFQIGCGSDGVCVSDLTISADLDQPFVEPYVIGSSEFVTLVFTVSDIQGNSSALRPGLG